MVNDGTPLMRALFMACAPLALCACGETVPEEPPAPAQTETTDPGAPYRQALMGEYRVRRVDGQAPDLGHDKGATVTISAERIHYQSDCVYGDWTYRVDRGVLYTDRWAEPGAPMCVRPLHAGEVAIERVFDAVDSWRRMPDGTLVIEGPKYSLELAALGEDSASEIASAEDLSGEYRVAGIDNSEIDGDQGIALSITGDTISFEPKCLGFAWTFTLEHGLLEIARDPRYGAQVSEDGSTVSCLPAVTPQYGELAGALDKVDRAVRTQDNGIVLSGGGRSVTIFSQ